MITIDAMINQLEKLKSEIGGDAEVLIQLEDIDKLPLRKIGTIFRYYHSDDNPCAQDRVWISTQTAHLGGGDHYFPPVIKPLPEFAEPPDEEHDPALDIEIDPIVYDRE